MKFSMDLDTSLTDAEVLERFNSAKEENLVRLHDHLLDTLVDGAAYWVTMRGSEEQLLYVWDEDNELFYDSLPYISTDGMHIHNVAAVERVGQ